MYENIEMISKAGAFVLARRRQSLRRTRDNYNKPWIESAMQRGDNIILWSNPIKQENLLKGFDDLPSGPTFYKRELDFIKENAVKFGYDYTQGIQIGVFKQK